MPLYVKQTDLFSCGPIALINVAKYYNFNLTKKDLSWIRKECRCSLGTKTTKLHEVMKYQLGHELGISSSTSFSAKEIREWVSQEENVAIIAYAWRERNKQGAHYITIIDFDIERNKFVIVNGHAATDPNGPVRECWSMRTLANRLRFSKYVEPLALPYGLFVTSKPRTTKKRKQK